MTNNSPPGVVRHRGLTLLELTDHHHDPACPRLHPFHRLPRLEARQRSRAGCVLTLRNVQVKHLFTKGYIEARLYQQARGKAPCPAGGAYTCPLPDVFPEAGQLYMQCSLSGPDNHVPTTHADW